MASVVLGSVALFGHVCCCIPIVSYAADFLIPLCEIGAIIVGLMALQEAKQLNEDPTMAKVGIGLGGAAICVSLMFIVFVFGIAAVLVVLMGGLANL